MPVFPKRPFRQLLPANGGPDLYSIGSGRAPKVMSTCQEMGWEKPGDAIIEAMVRGRVRSHLKSTIEESK